FSNLSINLSGGKTLKAASGALTPAISGSFSISPAAASQLAFVQQPTAATAGAAIAPAVTVQLEDTFGNSVPNAGVSVTMTLSGGDARFEWRRNTQRFESAINRCQRRGDFQQPER